MRGEYISYATDIIFNMPSPWGWFPVIWWRNGSAPITLIFVAIGLITNIATVVGSFYKWWHSVGIFLGTNAIFAFVTFLGAVGCRGEGCELAQTQMIAMIWQLAFIEIAVVFFALSAVGHIFTIVEEIYHHVRPLWEKLDSFWKFVICVTPAFVTAILPMAYAVFAGVFFGKTGPFDVVRSMMQDPLWISIWTASLIAMLPGLWAALKSEWNRDLA